MNTNARTPQALSGALAGKGTCSLILHTATVSGSMFSVTYFWKEPFNIIIYSMLVKFIWLSSLLPQQVPN